MKKQLLFLILFILLFVSFSCKKINLLDDPSQSTTISGFFSFSGNDNLEKLPSFRLNINSKSDNTFLINILTPFNSLVATMFFDNKQFIFLDMKNNHAYIDKAPPYSLKQIAGIDIELRDLILFFNQHYSKNPNLNYSKDFKSGKILTNIKGEIIIIGKKNFRAVLTPIGVLKRVDDMNFNIKIPEKFKVSYVN